MSKPRLYAYMRYCKRCKHYYYTLKKTSKFCDNCKKPIGSGKVKICNEVKRKDLKLMLRR